MPESPNFLADVDDFVSAPQLQATVDAIAEWIDLGAAYAEPLAAAPPEPEPPAEEEEHDSAPVGEDELEDEPPEGEACVRVVRLDRLGLAGLRECGWRAGGPAELG